jgi:GNAT superfamily N-acetyltransferase
VCGFDLIRFVVGCDLEEFKRYYRTAGLHDYFREFGITDVVYGELGPTEERIIKRDPSHLIVWKEGDKIIGDTIWHEESISGFMKSPEDKEVADVLGKLLGERREFVELHEVWLEKEYRGKGYGKRFFDFFESFVRKRGFDSIVYYTGYPAAMAICRKRGYKEACLSFPRKEEWYVFCLSPNQKTQRDLF